jgi:hypothetical protein
MANYPTSITDISLGPENAGGKSLHWMALVNHALDLRLGGSRSRKTGAIRRPSALASFRLRPLPKSPSDATEKIRMRRLAIFERENADLELLKSASSLQTRAAFRKLRNTSQASAPQANQRDDNWGTAEA